MVRWGLCPFYRISATGLVLVNKVDTPCVQQSQHMCAQLGISSSTGMGYRVARLAPQGARYNIHTSPPSCWMQLGPEALNRCLVQIGHVRTTSYGHMCKRTDPHLHRGTQLLVCIIIGRYVLCLARPMDGPRTHQSLQITEVSNVHKVVNRVPLCPPSATHISNTGDRTINGHMYRIVHK